MMGWEIHFSYLLFALNSSVHFSFSDLSPSGTQGDDYCFHMKIRDCSAWEWQRCAYSTKLLVFKKPNDWLVVTSFLYLTELPIRHLLFKGNASYFKSLGITGTVSETLMEKYSSEERPNISIQLPLRILDLFLSLFFLAAEQNAFYLWYTNTTSAKRDHFSPLIPVITSC